MTESYKPLVKIRDIEDFRTLGKEVVFGDRRDGTLYRYTDEIKLAVNVALATGRPLLVLGASGCGKSSLAFNLARVMQRRYYEYVVTSRSQARDLFYRFDAVRRLGDSQWKPASEMVGSSAEPLWKSQFPYVEPGPLWWCLDRSTAERRGCPGESKPPFPLAMDPALYQPNREATPGAILLIDEIDKAEPDFPSNLLVPLGSWQFTIEEVATPISLADVQQMQDPMMRPLVIITSNRERELPDTFLRRCIVLEIPSPTRERLKKIATTVFERENDTFFDEVIDELVKIRGEKELSIAEFLDIVQAISRLKADRPLQEKLIRQTVWRS